jgi:ribosome-associated protein
MADDDKPELTRRQARSRDRRDAGERSARIARELMAWKPDALAKLELPEDVREELTTARAISSQIARRRAERTLAGALRHADLDEIEAYMLNIQAKGNADPRLFHEAEVWRAKLIEEGEAAGFPHGYADPMPALVANARRERDTGKPPGAARALFRHVMSVLKSK